ncbi:hypothetical protein [Patiriisocius hiemis]|uniref:DUF3857 domain-containing protein n=1 Tax=Patiriisocius hiemis TaxID=3075604 RepID=A0ABU2YEZ4_9FLAO|nr:hypothetical protein [Constantimarinum sp. W242]MDT0556741.1 hypothetical protein [Constantimarinum sp. W242]
MTIIKYAVFIIAFTFSSLISAQIRQIAEFGAPTDSEKEMKTYDKEPDSSGVVLFEKGDYQIKLINDYIRLVKKVHKKIKVFNADEFNKTEVFIPLYNSKNSKEKITEIKAITHNGDTPTYVSNDAYFESKEDENWTITKFTFPNVKDGSILEYTYTIESPYLGSLDGWTFQEDLPKVYSEFSTTIPGNYVYNKIIVGFLKLDVDEATIEKYCLDVPGAQTAADCEKSIYAINHIPSFKEEPYMLSEKNFLSKIKYELREVLNFDGSKERYAKTWKDVDKEFKLDKDMGRQLKYSNFFEDKLPGNILSIKEDLERAKAIYTFIQNHYTWDGYYRIFSDVRVKEAFEKGSGNNTEINLSLINALEAGNIDAKIALLSTRNNGLPTELNPVMTDFNHSIAYATIGTSTYLLDATNKFTPFGEVPFKDLNRKVRVMDFKKGSFWLPIVPIEKNVYYINTKLKLNEINEFEGSVNGVYTGYIASGIREDLSKTSKSNFLKRKESNQYVSEVTNLAIENEYELSKPLKETYDVLIETEEVSNKIYFNPICFETYFKKNPFTQEKRQFPLDFGYPIVNTYLISIDIGEDYNVTNLPESKAVKLNGNQGECSILYSQSGSTINVRFNLRLPRYNFQQTDYKNLKDFFDNVVKIQKQEVIVIEKK